MDTISEIHQLLSRTVWLFFIALGGWGFYRAARGEGVDGSYLGTLVIGELLYVAQGVLGAILWSGGLSGVLTRPGIHVLYGVFAIVFLPFVYLVWLRGDDSNRAMWVWAFATTFLFGIALRGIYTSI